jgi:menaquinone-dependent protoporphyrinogen oxidase
MKRVGVLYATREGHTRKIAERVAAELRVRGLDADVLDVRDLEAATDLGGYAAVVLAASVHRGQHEKEMIRFVKRHRVELERIPAAFLSASLSEVGVEQLDRPPEERAEFAADVLKVLDQFFTETGWHPARVKAVAGELAYTRYNFLVRFIMKRIARKAGAATDTSRDHDYTDWAALDRFADELAQEISEPVEAMASAGAPVR